MLRPSLPPILRSGLLVLPGLLILLTAACSGGSLQVSDEALTSRQFTGDSNGTKGMAAVSGIARNMSDSSISDCKVNVVFYDEHGGSLGSSEVDRSSLGPGETWNFTVQLTSPDTWKARSYKLTASNR